MPESQGKRPNALTALKRDNAEARKSGLQKGDLIVSANGQPVTSLIELRRVIYRTGVDGLLHCVVVREGKELSVSFALIDSLE